jgi:hypothetical protein
MYTRDVILIFRKGGNKSPKGGKIFQKGGKFLSHLHFLKDQKENYIKRGLIFKMEQGRRGFKKRYLPLFGSLYRVSKRSY